MYELIFVFPCVLLRESVIVNVVLALSMKSQASSGELECSYSFCINDNILEVCAIPARMCANTRQHLPQSFKPTLCVSRGNNFILSFSNLFFVLSQPDRDNWHARFEEFTISTSFIRRKLSMYVERLRLDLSVVL